jgi:hypothetical protein
MKNRTMATLILIGVLSLLVTPIQADFIQCPGGGGCAGTANNDLINGTPDRDGIDAGPGDDLVFGGDGQDTVLEGDSGGDMIFGGAGSDAISGGPGDDIILAGPDDLLRIQGAFGGTGNDTFYVLVGETANCYEITGNEDFDAVNFIGFGPYSAALPFGQEMIPFPSWIIIEDPVAGGLIFILVATEGSESFEQINGLLSPHVAIVDDAMRIQIQGARCVAAL